MKKQHPTQWPTGGGRFRLIPPTHDDFHVAGTPDTVHRARTWAIEGKYLLYEGSVDQCVHGLYRMDTCAARDACGRGTGFDHTNIWVEHDATGAFILTQPYTDTIPDAMRTYAAMHGLEISSGHWDGWYGSGTLPIRLTIPRDWPLWPIERDAVVALHASPIPWED